MKPERKASGGLKWKRFFNWISIKIRYSTGKLEAGSKVTDVELVKNRTLPQNSKLILSLYNKSNRLEYININDINTNNLQAGSNLIPVNMALPSKDLQGYKLKTYLWDSFNNIQSLLSAKEETPNLPLGDGLQMEYLDRGLVAVKTADGVYLSWRYLGTEPADIAYNIYKNGLKLNSERISTKTNYMDTLGLPTDKYSVSAIYSGIEMERSKDASVWASN